MPWSSIGRCIPTRCHHSLLPYARALPRPPSLSLRGSRTGHTQSPLGYRHRAHPASFFWEIVLSQVESCPPPLLPSPSPAAGTLHCPTPAGRTAIPPWAGSFQRVPTGLLTAGSHLPVQQSPTGSPRATVVLEVRKAGARCSSAWHSWPQAPPSPARVSPFRLLAAKNSAGFASADGPAPGSRPDLSVSSNPIPRSPPGPAAEASLMAPPPASAPPPRRRSHCSPLQQSSPGPRAALPPAQGTWPARSQVRAVPEGLGMTHHAGQLSLLALFFLPPNPRKAASPTLPCTLLLPTSWDLTSQQ